MSPFQQVLLEPNPALTPEAVLKHLGLDPSDPAQLEKARRSLAQIEAEKEESQCFRNDTYQVLMRFVPKNEHQLPCGVVHLSIKRLDREPIHDWRDLQEIKNAIIGTEHEAVELYPAESRKVDSANQYHLWALFGEDLAPVHFPVGWNEGRMVTQGSLAGSKQRPFKKGEA